MPMPCSAEIEPAIAVMRSLTARVIAGAYCCKVGRSMPLGAPKPKCTLPSPIWPSGCGRRLGRISSAALMPLSMNSGILEIETEMS